MSAQAEAKDYPSATEILTGAGAKLGQACAVRAPEKGLVIRRGILTTGTPKTRSSFRGTPTRLTGFLWSLLADPQNTAGVSGNPSVSQKESDHFSEVTSWYY